MGTAEDGVFDALSIDWELESGAVAENTHRKSPSNLAQEMNMQQQMQKHLRSLSKNNPLSNHLYMHGVISFTILSTFFEHNHNLPSLLKY